MRKVARHFTHKSELSLTHQQLILHEHKTSQIKIPTQFFKFKISLPNQTIEEKKKKKEREDSPIKNRLKMFFYLYKYENI